MKCPKCGSEHVQFVTSTETTGFSGSNSCCGFLLMGPIGLLCGLCGSGYSTTSEYWVCHECGTKFQAKEAQETQQARLNRLAECEELLKNVPDDIEAQHSQIAQELDEVTKFVENGCKQLKADYSDYRRASFFSNLGLAISFVGIFLGILCNDGAGDLLFWVIFGGIVLIGIVIESIASGKQNKLFEALAPLELKLAKVQKGQLAAQKKRMEDQMKAKQDKKRLEQELHQDRSKDE